MPRRKHFLAALGIAGAVGLSRAASAAQTSVQPQVSAAPAASPAPSALATVAAAKAPSAASLATAQTMRRFDPKLGDDEIRTIALGIDDAASAGPALNSKKHRLRNGDEPATTFKATV